MILNKATGLAFSLLTSEWQPLRELQHKTGFLGDYAFFDLEAGGLAEVKRDPIIRNRIACGEKTYYRRRK